MDCACGVGSLALSGMLQRLASVGLTVNLVNRVGEGVLNEGALAL